MRAEYLDVIKLLRSALTGEKLLLTPDFSIDGIQSILKRHGVQAMGYIGAVNCGVPRNDPDMQSLFAAYRQNILISQNQLNSAETLFHSFDKAGIDYLPLKGLILKHLYPYPELRPMGDGDILIRMSQYPEIREVMLSLGYEEGQESDHELPWKSKGLYVELHKHLVPTTDRDLFGYYDDGWNLARKSAGSRYHMSDEDTFVFLFAHFAKHFRAGGIGCRHTVDLWVYRSKHPKMNEDYILDQLKKLCLDVFYQNILAVMNAWFYDKPYNRYSEFITECIFDNGIWGTAENLYIAESLRSAEGTDSVRRGKWRLLFSRIFLNLQEMQYRYPVLIKHSYLLPVYWVWRIIELPFHNSRVVSSRISWFQKNSEDKILKRKNDLEFVGFYGMFREEPDK